ncbi:undecaprenyldiphospho-muramoylpentapeptide beta-N-acetylglucosaminyltransferase [Bacteroidota bacterium]
MKKNLQQPKKRIILSGGGTGGHIFPAIAIANALKVKLQDPEILFIGAKGRMEMEKVPKAGYNIKGLWISGLQRKLTAKNLLFPIKLISSLLKAKSIISSFKPDVVIGTGGYASGPTLRMASSKGIPCLIQEQNSFPGITNRLLSSRVSKICVAYDNMDKYFPQEKIIKTGNPVRKDITILKGKKEAGLKEFALSASKPILLIVGGSQGALSINLQIIEMIKTLIENDIQLLWQTGVHFADTAKEKLNELKNEYHNADELIKIAPFIYQMDLAYSIADVVISRGGAIAISELCVAGKACILVPLPSAAEDHQTKNAQSLVDKKAAIMVRDNEMSDKLHDLALELLQNKEKQKVLSENILKMAIPDAADRIAEEVIKIIK